MDLFFVYFWCLLVYFCFFVFIILILFIYNNSLSTTILPITKFKYPRFSTCHKFWQPQYLVLVSGILNLCTHEENGDICTNGSTFAEYRAVMAS
jgi:hypothetical protein